MANSKAKLNSNGEKASPHFKQTATGVLGDKYFPILSLFLSSI